MMIALLVGIAFLFTGWADEIKQEEKYPSNPKNYNGRYSVNWWGGKKKVQD